MSLTSSTLRKHFTTVMTDKLIHLQHTKFSFSILEILYLFLAIFVISFAAMPYASYHLKNEQKVRFSLLFHSPRPLSTTSLKKATYRLKRTAFVIFILFTVAKGMDAATIFNILPKDERMKQHVTSNAPKWLQLLGSRFACFLPFQTAENRT